MKKRYKIPKIGLALGSGGARGLAHIGVLKVLKENQIPIDFIVGVSSGSVVGAYYALNLEIELLEKKVKELRKKDFFKLVDISSPRRALIRGNKIKNYFNELIQNKSFSDTKIPLKIIVTELCSGKEVQIHKGKLIDAIRASISLPGIFPPAKINDELFIDGGVVNPTPVDVVKKMGADIVIGVDLTLKHPVKIENPNIVETLMRSFDILRTQTTKLNVNKVNNAVIIKPNFSGKLDSYRFYENKKFIEEGERVTRKALPKIKALIRGELK